MAAVFGAAAFRRNRVSHHTIARRSLPTEIYLALTVELTAAVTALSGVQPNLACRRRRTDVPHRVRQLKSHEDRRVVLLVIDESKTKPE